MDIGNPGFKVGEHTDTDTFSNMIIIFAVSCHERVCSSDFIRPARPKLTKKIDLDDRLGAQARVEKLQFRFPRDRSVSDSTSDER